MKTSIRTKILATLTLLILLVSTLAGTGLYTLRLYQQQVRDVSWRVNVLPVAGNMSRHVTDLQTNYSELQGVRSVRPPFSHLADAFSADLFHPSIELRFDHSLSALKQSYEEYRRLLEARVAEIGLDESFAEEFSTVDNIRSAIQELDDVAGQRNWSTAELRSWEKVELLLDTLRQHTDRLPVYLTDELRGYSHTMRHQSGWLRLTVIVCVTVSIVLMLLLIRLSFVWIFSPLHVLIEGSRKVAGGKYDTRIVLESNDEIAELADAMNFMTEQFQEQVRQLEESRRNLDAKVQQKSRELVRSERLASVGFLAAGVAHEINNPLMAISACAESLQKRIDSKDAEYFKRYLTMIQEEAFRCKGITERLLGLARNESRERVETDLVPIVTDMLEMIRQQDAFKRKHITVNLPESLKITANAQEMKQVVLNLLTNAFQNTDDDGEVLIRLYWQEAAAVLSIQDDGHGMDSEVLQNIFEPFYSRRVGGSGNGLGLSITHRIIEEHRGRISVFSAGLGRGAKFVVELPKESEC